MRDNRRPPAATIIIIAATLGGFGLRLYRLGAGSLWYDETVSALLASRPVPALIAHTAADIHPPGYYLLLRFWRGLAGGGEFSLCFFSLFFGVLLIPTAYALGRRFAGRASGVWSALLVAVSPYNVWYSQEARMYTLAAFLGMVVLWCALRFYTGEGGGNRALFGYVFAAAAGLYVLYYFSFLLVALNLAVLALMLLKTLLNKRYAPLKLWLAAQVAVIGLYVPWIPVAWKQAADPPVPPWRGFTPLPRLVVEAWGALSVGQSMALRHSWPVLLLTALLFSLGVWHLFRLFLRLFQRNRNGGKIGAVKKIEAAAAPSIMAAYLLGPVAIIYAASFVSPLYHVRYVFTYSTTFYVLCGIGLAWLWGRWKKMAVASALAIAMGSFFSLGAYYFNPLYAPDDFRSAVGLLSDRLRPGDAVLINAGYTYTAFLYYYDAPIPVHVARLTGYDGAEPGGGIPVLMTGSIGGSESLGWGSPESDFYATTWEETESSLERVAAGHPRLWMIRVYDTVTDPDGLVRGWLADNCVMYEDVLFAGEANMRLQGFLTGTLPEPLPGQEFGLSGGVTLAGYSVPPIMEARAGDSIDAYLYWRVEESAPPVDYAASLKLWRYDGAMMAQEDEWPVGNRYFTSAWTPGEVVCHPMRLRLPADLPPGVYWLDVEVYDPATVLPLERLDGGGHTVPLGEIHVLE